MDKKATTSVPINDLIANRWSPRSFSGEAVSAESVTAIFEAARWAASAFNNQPWSFIVATKDNADAHQQMVDCLMPGNQPWAVNAPVLAFVVAKTIIDATADKPARPSGTAVYDCGLAVSQLTIQAAHEGLHVHQMAGINRDKIIETFNIPADHHVICGLAIGHVGTLDDLANDSLRQREQAPRGRKPRSAKSSLAAVGAKATFNRPQTAFAVCGPPSTLDNPPRTPYAKTQIVSA